MLDQVTSSPGAVLSDSLLPPGGHFTLTADEARTSSVQVVIPWALTVGPMGGTTALFLPSNCLGVKLEGLRLPVK